MLSLMLCGGLRVGELITLTFDSFDDSEDENASVKIRVWGKGQKERVAYMLRSEYLSVQSYIAEYPKESRNGLLFLNHRGQPLTVSGIQWLMREYSKKSGISFSAHRLRHTCARRLAEGHMSILSLSRFLGHSHLQTTQRYIDGADPKVRQAYAQAFKRVDNRPVSLESNVVQKVNELTESKKETTVFVKVPDGFVPPQSIQQLPDWMHKDCLDWLSARWYRWKPTRRERNTHRAWSALKVFLHWWLLGSVATGWEEVDNRCIREYIKYNFEREMTASTTKSYLDHLFKFLRFLEKEERLKEVPKQPEIELPQALPRRLSPQELLAVEQVVKNESQKDDGDKLSVALYYLLTRAGLRSCETLDLQMRDLDLNNNRIRINEGKNGRDRVVYLTDMAREALIDYLQTVPHAPGDLVISRNAEALDGGQVKRLMKKLGKKAGIENMYPQRLRHTYATTLVNNGMDVDVLQMLMGHENMNTTLIYARLADQTVESQHKQAMQRFEKQDVTPKNE